MSASAAAARPVPSVPVRRPGATQPRPRLGTVPIEVVPGQKVALRPKAWPFILIAAVLVVLTVVLPMVVNTQMAQRAYEIRDQQIVLSELNAQVETLEAEVLIAASPSKLRERAEANGLVPSGAIGAISLTERTIEGGEPAQ